MASVNCDVCKGGYFYMDNRLSNELESVRYNVLDKDDDRVFIVDGGEGAGKSVLSMQLAYKLDPSFNITRVVYSPEDFKRAIFNAKRGQAVVFDEAFKGLSSRSVFSEVNKLLISLMMEMRQKNLFVFVVLPSFFLLDKYVAIHRSAGLFHVYKKGGKRGYWTFFNRKKKQILYIRGKKDMTYGGNKIPKSSFKGRFLNQYVVDESEYRKLKSKALKNISTDEKDDESKFKWHRDVLIRILAEVTGYKSRSLSLYLKSKGFVISKSSIYNILKQK